jgi:parvulin-like peptidyl-prolyl isomerase
MNERSVRKIRGATALATFCVLALSAAWAAGCGNKAGGAGGNVVAEVGSKKITSGELLITYDRITPPNRPPFDTLEDKKAFLETAIAKEILVQEAQTRGLDKSVEVEAGVKKLRDTELLKRMFVEKSQKVVELTPEELEAHYKETQAQVHLADIWLKDADKAKADEIRAEIRGGASFAEMAKKHGQNEYAAAGGDMGWHAVSAPMLEFFAEQLKTMKPGDVSDPVPLLGGYHIIQVLERKDADMAEFEEKKIPVRQELRRKKEAEAWRAYIQEIRAAKQLTVSPENVQIVKDRFASTAAGQLPQLSDSEKALPLVSYEGDSWTAGDLIYYLGSVGPSMRPDFTDPRFDPSNWLMTRATNDMVLKEAAKAGFEKQSDFQETLAREREKLSLDALHAELIKEISVSDDEKVAFYEEKKDSLIGPAVSSVRYIFTTSQARIDSAYAEIQAGKPFAEVVKRYTEDPNTRDKGGVVDSIAYGVFGDANMDNGVLALKPDEVSKPIVYNQAFYIFKKIETRPGKALTYAEAAPQIETHLKSKKETELFDTWLTQKREALNVKIYDKALDAIQTEQTGAA